MKTLKAWIPVLSTLFLCGCFQVQDELTLAPDGSGKVTLTLRSNLRGELIEMMNSGFQEGGSPIYPPISEEEAQQFFPAKNFELKVEQKSADDGKTLIIEASFKDVNALLASPYGRAHQLNLKTNGTGELVLQALSGGSTLALAAQFKPQGDMPGLDVSAIEEAQKKKNEMRFAFRVSLPNNLSAQSGMREGKSVTWAVERSKCKDDEEFAIKLADLLEASCSAEGIKFSPVTPTRLGLLPFNQLPAGKAVDLARMPDTNQVVAAARFMPYVLQVTRTMDLNGEGVVQGSQAQLIGAVVLPAELAPYQWGQPTLEEAEDAKGNSLMPKEESAGSLMFRMSHMESMVTPDQTETDKPGAADPHTEPSEKRHLVSLNFRAPEWKIKQIARIKGAIELQYLGGSEVIKLSNAVPADLVMTPTNGSSPNYNFASDRGQISNARLAELNMSLRVQMAMVQGAITILTLETGGKSALLDAQVFDADGRPWPTTLTQSPSTGAEDHSCQIMVAGKPKPPFSLAFAVGGMGASIEMSILLEHVPVSDK